MFSAEELMFYTEGQTYVNFPFGQSEKDVIKVSVFNFDETPVTSSTIISSGSYTSNTQSYYDVTNKYVTYSYDEFNSNFPLLDSIPSSSLPTSSMSETGSITTSSLFLDVSKVLNGMSISDGNYKVSIELIRNLVGTEPGSSEKLIIDTISTSRTEIAVIPKVLKGTQSTTVDEFNVFSNSQIQVKEIAKTLTDAISSPPIYTVYYAAKEVYPEEAASFKFNYGLNYRQSESGNDIDAINLLTDMFYGVKKGNLKNSGEISTNDILGIYDQFKNWLYQNYEAGATFQDVRDYYYSIFKFVTNQELNRITNKKPDDYESILKFLEYIYYNLIFYPEIYTIEVKNNIYLSGYFKNYINVVGGDKYSILNRKISPSNDPRFYDKLILKLSEPLPASVMEGDEIWITNDFGFLPIVQSLYYFTKPYVQTIPLRGPNFLVRVESQGNTTEALSMEELVNQTGSAYNEIISKINTPEGPLGDNTNYRYFENFINFSSANLRLVAFDSKRSEIVELQAQIVNVQNKLNANPSDQFYQKEITDYNNRIDAIEASMDGYENFLYNNAEWYPEHVASASVYDRNNGNSLINNLPQFIVEESDQNADYIKFVGMIGHFFDNISLTIKQLTEKNNTSSSPSSGISIDIVEDMLASMGWEAEISKENLPLLLASFSKAQFDVTSPMYDQVRSMSEMERNQVIWKRILNSLPYIYKTKGTEASLSALLSCFGVPKNIIKLKEYGGIRSSHNLQDTTEYVIDEVKYEPYFTGSGEYFKLNWTGSAQTFEFNFAFDQNRTSEEGHVFRLANCSDKWVVGVYRDRGNEWGRLFFSLDDGVGNVKTIMTEKAPIFDGSTYHAMVRRNDASVDFAAYDFTPSQIDQYPIKYDVVLQRAEDSRITFEATASQYLSGSFNTNYRVGSFVYVGNYHQNTASLNVDPEAFYGNIDEIKIWENSLDDNSFLNHTLHQNSYDSNSPIEMVKHNLVRVSFERPLDLNDGSGTVVLNNLAFRGDFPTFDAINFPPHNIIVPTDDYCAPLSVPTFPYQFTRKETVQTMKVPDYGAGKFKSNKINYVEQELLTALSSTERSSVKSSELTSTDSNKIGIFFSPSEIQNTEIIKFFGEYPLTDLIGDPKYVYERSYERFEKFKQIFYDQGYGAVDYQFFMNIVRFYFDKAMFKYIKNVVPARAKLVDGILVEPSILERPKIQLKPLVQENIPQKLAEFPSNRDIAATQAPKLEHTFKLHNDGISILNDVNQVFFPADADQFGFSVFADNGITYYKDEYYRADVIKVKKQYQVYNKYNLPTNELDDYEINVNMNGTVQTISSSYYKVNMVKLPNLSEYSISASFVNSYFSGSVSFTPSTLNVPTVYAVSSSHTISGLMTGSVNGFGLTSTGTVLSPGIYINAAYSNIYPIYYNGTFTTDGGNYYFVGIIYAFPTPPQFSFDKFVITFTTNDPTKSIFDEFRFKTSGNFFGPLASGFDYRKEYTMQNYPYNAELLNGYFPNHYKYSKQQFSVKEINSYDNNNSPFKWKKNIQNKKTTVDPLTGLLNNSDPVETKTV
jgi:hypothetical protein